MIVYGGQGKATRNWACFDRIVKCLKKLKTDETLLIQSGKPVGVFPTQEFAPRVLIANSLLVPAWANWVAVHRGGGVGIGYSIHAGLVAVAEGTNLAAKKLSLVLNNNPGIGIARHADAGYKLAITTAKQKKIRIPELTY